MTLKYLSLFFLDCGKVFPVNSFERLSKDFFFVKAEGKPTTMALRYVDKFSEETLQRSTMFGSQLQVSTSPDPKITPPPRCKVDRKLQI